MGARLVPNLIVTLLHKPVQVLERVETIQISVNDIVVLRNGAGAELSSAAPSWRGGLR